MAESKVTSLNALPSNSRGHQHQKNSKQKFNSDNKKFKQNTNVHTNNQSFDNKFKRDHPKSKVKFGAKIRNNKVGVEGNVGKKPFDKKEWRLKKYSKKYKLSQWEDKKKKQTLKQYYQQISDEANTPKFDVQKIYAENFDSDEERATNPVINFVKHPDYVPSKEQTANSVKSLGDEGTSKAPDKNVAHRKGSAFQKAAWEFQRLKDEKQRNREEYLRKQAERQEALKTYKKNKAEKFKKLSKKNKKGQPIMKDRLEMLLEQIQATT